MHLLTGLRSELLIDELIVCHQKALAIAGGLQCTRIDSSSAQVSA